MKVVIIAPYMTSKGGAARFSWELSEYLISQGDFVTVISLYTDKTLYPLRDNLKIIDLADTHTFTQSIKFWLTLRKIRGKLRVLVNQEKPDIIIFMNFPATLWAQKFINIPIFCYPQDIDLLYMDTYIRNLSLAKYLIWRIVRFFIRSYDKNNWKWFDEVICNSKYSSERISKVYGVKTRVIHLGTRTNVFKPSKNTKKKVILSIAAQKSQRTDFLIESVRKLHQERKDFEIWVVGSSGYHDNELRKLVAKYNLTEFVKFFGKVDDSTLAKLYSESLVTVHLVRKPPFGMIVTESMSSETPVIACKPGGTEETILNGETGFLIDENDSSSLIKYIKKFLDNPELSEIMGKKGRIRVQQLFEMSDKNKELRELMKEYVTQKY